MNEHGQPKFWHAVVAFVCIWLLGLSAYPLVAGALERAPSRTSAVVKCGYPLTEDSAALAELVRFERAADGSIVRLVYRCGTP